MSCSMSNVCCRRVVVVYYVLCVLKGSVQLSLRTKYVKDYTKQEGTIMHMA